MYKRQDTDNSFFMVRTDRSRLIPMSYDSPITTEYWDDASSPEYRAMFERVEREGMVLEKP